MDKTQTGADTAEKILRVATELLEQKGYAAISMRRVGELVGVSQAAIYRHYRDKDDLMLRIIGDGYADLASRIETLASSRGTLEERLCSAFHGYIDFVLERPSLFKALLLQDIGPAGRAIDALGAGVSRQRRTFELLATMLREGMDSGVFERAEPELTAQALWSAVFGLAARLAIEESPAEKAALLVERQLNILIRGLRTRSEAKR